MPTPTIRPLRKKNITGETYTHVANIATLIHELLSLPEEDLVRRCSSPLEELTDFVPSECILYLVRTKHGKNPKTSEMLFKILAERVLRRLPPRSNVSGAISLTGSNITDEAFGNFIHMLSQDSHDYCEALDYYEVRFNDALKKLSSDAKKKVWRREKRSVPFDVDQETGELPKDLEKAVGVEEAFDAKKLEQAEFRARLQPAINSLPPLQRRILELIRLEIPIYSENPTIMTIAKALGKAEKTIRNQRDQAFVSLQGMLNGETLQ